MNVAIVERATAAVIVRYEIHRAGAKRTPPDEVYFDEAWRRAVAEGLVEADRRDAYEFKLQRPKNLYESSQ